ncbi:hypothetical protein ACQKWADRAFT_298244 [Trichoderma austrokoningii]
MCCGIRAFDAALARALAYVFFNALYVSSYRHLHRLKRHRPHAKEPGACKKLCRTLVSIHRHTPQLLVHLSLLHDALYDKHAAARDVDFDDGCVPLYRTRPRRCVTAHHLAKDPNSILTVNGLPWKERFLAPLQTDSGLLGTERPKNNRRGPQSVVEQRVSMLHCWPSQQMLEESLLQVRIFWRLPQPPSL